MLLLDMRALVFLFLAPITMLDHQQNDATFFSDPEAKQNSNIDYWPLQYPVTAQQDMSCTTTQSELFPVSFVDLVAPAIMPPNTSTSDNHTSLLDLHWLLQQGSKREKDGMGGKREHLSDLYGI